MAKLIPTRPLSSKQRNEDLRYLAKAVFTDRMKLTGGVLTQDFVNDKKKLCGFVLECFCMGTEASWDATAEDQEKVEAWYGYCRELYDKVEPFFISLLDEAKDTGL